ncbi:MAG: winged helix-turn-helix domain-containing protein [Candidatus Helarchaeota archaeon]
MAQLLTQKTSMVSNQEIETQVIKLSPSIKEIYSILKEKGPQTPKEISAKTSYAPRTLRYALKKLLELNLIKKTPNFEDLRQNYYKIKN